MSKSVLRLSLAAVALTLGACAHQPGPRYGHGGVQDTPPIYSPSRHGEPRVEYGQVAGIETVQAERRGGSTGAGGVIGAVAGAVIGRQFGNSGDGRATGTVLGALGGAVLGDTIERQQRGGGGGSTVYRVSVQLERGGMRAFDFQSVGDLRVGDRVRVENGQMYRL